ncbi:MAG: hypothetical protein U5J83_04795 [Bryobacterales bacterium]|nr:hypothetical protein [Bryobacterales bacterium]
MELRLELERTGRLHCHFTQREQTTTFSAYDGATALALLEAATEDLARAGCGECYWQMANGEYRLSFRRTPEDTVRIAILWANGIATGWEHVLWSERPAEEWLSTVRGALTAAQGEAPAPRA